MKTLSSEGCSAKFYQLDIISLESIQKFKKFLEEQYGGLDILINNAGIAYKVYLYGCLNPLKNHS